MTINYYDIIVTKEEIPAELLFDYIGERKSITIPKDFLLQNLVIDFDLEDKEEKHYPFFSCVDYQSFEIGRRAGINKKDFYEMYSSENYIILISESVLEEKCMKVSTFNTNYLTPNFFPYIRFIVLDYLYGKNLPKKITDKFYRDETEMKAIIENYNDAIITYSEAYNQLIQEIRKQNGDN